MMTPKWDVLKRWLLILAVLGLPLIAVLARGPVDDRLGGRVALCVRQTMPRWLLVGAPLVLLSLWARGRFDGRNRGAG
jgi:hypothetical protein